MLNLRRCKTEQHNGLSFRFFKVIREKIPGESFGEKIITRESSKMATVISKGRSEFLRVDKDEIEKV